MGGGGRVKKSQGKQSINKGILQKSGRQRMKIPWRVVVSIQKRWISKILRLNQLTNDCWGQLVGKKKEMAMML
jgi:hypothetical protein